MKIKNTKLAVMTTILAVGLMGQFKSQAEIDTKKLGEIILQKITNTIPNLPVAGWNGFIASQCKDAANHDDLKAKLITVLSTDPLATELKYTVNKDKLNLAVGDIADAQFPPQQPPAPDPLPASIAKYLDQCPGIDTNQVAGWNKYIASACSSPKNYGALRAKLIDVFSNDGKLTWLNYEQNRLALDSAASQIADETYPSAQKPNQKPPKLASVNTNSNWLVAFSSGAQFLDPYNISVPKGATKGPNGTLVNSGNSTVGYLQFDVLRHWAFNPSPFPTNNLWANRFPLVYGPFTDNFDWDSITPEFQFTFGFLLGNSVKSTNNNNTYTAQTLAGSDIYGTLGAGLPLWRSDWEKDSGGFSAQVSLWGSLGATTENSFEKVHVNQFIGGMLDIGLPPDVFGNTNVLTRGLVEAKVGMGHLDFPSMTGTANQVNLDGNGAPIFTEKWVPVAGANLLIPFGSVLYLNIEANAFIQDETPSQWNVKVGATVPWSSVQKMFPFIK